MPKIKVVLVLAPSFVFTQSSSLMFDPSIIGIHSNIRRFCVQFLVCPFAPQLFLATMVLTGNAVGQSNMSFGALHDEAINAFETKHWELAHRRIAELLSLDGTDTFLQMCYGATLLHDARMRDEGIQRLASLADAGKLEGEGWYWWGRALMLQGEPQLAEAALLKALEEADKKSSWIDECLLALAQARSLPMSFDVMQPLRKLDALSVSPTSYHRYVDWGREGVRIMLAPQELQSRLDKKNRVNSPVTLWQGQKELFYHSLGSKKSQRLNIFTARLDEEGEFSKKSSLSNQVNSQWDDINPVWDPALQCLTFASNRPGTVGGFDLFQTCRKNDTWSIPRSLGPMFNSVHDDLAFYPPHNGKSGWLVTGRQAAYGGIEVWEVDLTDGPLIPVNLNTQWEVSGEVIPGTLRLIDTESEEAIAEIELGKTRVQWNMVVGAGQLFRYSFETKNGETFEGTYAIPSVEVPSSLSQSIAMRMVDGSPSLNANMLTQAAEPSSDLKWGWNSVLGEVSSINIPELVALSQETVPDVLVDTLTPKRDWTSIWLQYQSERMALFDFQEEILATTKNDTNSWFKGLSSWISERIKNGGVMHPCELVHDAAWTIQTANGSAVKDMTDSELTKSDLNASSQEDVLRKSKIELLEALMMLSDGISDPDDALHVLEATWVVALWINHTNWKHQSPEQIQACIPNWPSEAQKRISDMRMIWARSDQNEWDTDSLLVSEEALSARLPIDDRKVYQNESRIPAEGSQSEEVDMTFSQPDVMGKKGVHLGWFKQEPHLQSLPEGTALENQLGANGLTRWVLVFPRNVSSNLMQSIESWLMRQRIYDSFEVFRDEDGWIKSMSEMNLVLNEKGASNAGLHTPKKDIFLVDSSAICNDQKVQNLSGWNLADQEWGSDNLWANGAPVALENLRGIWYAVQVGAFHGLPDKGWIEMAGERLVYEPYGDGLARWYAGVRQDKSSSISRLLELQQFDTFSDAFIVRLKDGEREAVRSEEETPEGSFLVLEDKNKKANEENVTEAVVKEISIFASPTGGSVDVLGGLTGQEQLLKAHRHREAHASPALVTSSQILIDEAKSWYVDIASYYGTVPSQDVALLLIKSADWGVKSVQLFDQTIYFSRSFDDLEEAQQLLRSIQSEGFTNAMLVQK